MRQRTENMEKMEVKHLMLSKQRKRKQDNSYILQQFGDLRKNIEYLIGIERQSGRMEEITPLYVSRMLNVPLEEVKKVMKDIDVR